MTSFIDFSVSEIVALWAMASLVLGMVIGRAISFGSGK